MSTEPSPNAAPVHPDGYRVRFRRWWYRWRHRDWSLGERVGFVFGWDLRLRHQPNVYFVTVRRWVGRPDSDGSGGFVSWDLVVWPFHVYVILSR